LLCIWLLIGNHLRKILSDKGGSPSNLIGKNLMLHSMSRDLFLSSFFFLSTSYNASNELKNWEKYISLTWWILQLLLFGRLVLALGYQYHLHITYQEFSFHHGWTWHSILMACRHVFLKIKRSISLNLLSFFVQALHANALPVLDMCKQWLAQYM